jgi:alpha-amylase
MSVFFNPASPCWFVVVKQVPWRDHWNGTGYHGYWAADFNAIDPHLGSEADLKALSAGCAARSMLFMLDVVVNHVGPISTVEQLGLLGPGLNSTAGQQMHTLERAQNQTLQSYIDHPVQMNQAGDKPFGSGAPGVCWPNCSFGGGCNLTVIQDGWFGDLADLRQEDPSVVMASYLLDWIRTMVTKYNVDGIRLDTVSYVPKWFLTKFQAAVDVYIVGEVVTLNHSMHRSFATPEGPLMGCSFRSPVSGPSKKMV